MISNPTRSSWNWTGTSLQRTSSRWCGAPSWVKSVKVLQIWGILLVSLDSLSGVSVKKCSSNCDWSINFNTSHGLECWVDHIIYEHQSDLKSYCSDRSIMLRSFFPSCQWHDFGRLGVFVIDPRWLIFTKSRLRILCSPRMLEDVCHLSWLHGLCCHLFWRKWSDEWPTSLRICGWTRLQLVARNSSVSSPLRERRGVSGRNVPWRKTMSYPFFQRSPGH